VSGLGFQAARATSSPAARSFSRALWAQALFAGLALALASSNPASFSLGSSNPLSLFLVLVAGALAGVVLGAVGKTLSRRAELGLAFAAFLFVPVDYLLLDADFASAFARALLVLQVAKLLGPRERRDESTILVVALAHMAVAASSTVELSFLPVFLGYGVTAGYALAVRELRGAPSIEASAKTRVTFGFRATEAAIALATAALAGAIFVVMPRVGAKLLPIPRGSQGDRLSGFSDTIQLDQSGRIRESQRLAFRAMIVERGRLPAVPLWRGRALDVYRDSVWSFAPIRERLEHQFFGENGVFVLPERKDRPDPERLLKSSAVVELQLEPMHTVTIFAPGVVHRIDWKTTAPPMINRDFLGTLSTYQQHLSETSYRVTCSPELLVPDYERDERERRRCTKLPQEVDRERLADYARRVLAASGLGPSSPPEQVARALEDHLGKTFKYTLDAKHEEGAERVSEFLFTTKAGHCEIFASALAVLLRSLDVPARVVNGYKGGEYHAWSDSYTVRERHAHSWVEALTRDGWLTLDATPAVTAEQEAATGLVATLEDAREWLEIAWFKNVIAFDSGDQAGIGKSLRGALDPQLGHWDDLRQTGRDVLERGGRRDLGILGGLLAVLLVLGTAGVTVGPRALLAALGALVARFGRRVHGEPRTAFARELEPLLRALERRGVVRRQGETMRELAARASETLGPSAAPVEEIVPGYYEARYGGRDLRSDERAAIARAVRSVTSSRDDR
jgi:transglutaminase-like putative cysteine protease